MAKIGEVKPVTLYNSLEIVHAVVQMDRKFASWQERIEGESITYPKSFGKLKFKKDEETYLLP